MRVSGGRTIINRTGATGSTDCSSTIVLTPYAAEHSGEVTPYQGKSLEITEPDAILLPSRQEIAEVAGQVALDGRDTADQRLMTIKPRSSALTS